MWKAKKPLEFIISSTLKSLEDMREELKYVYMDISDWQKKGHSIEKLEAISERDLVYIASAFHFLDEYIDLMNSIDKEFKTDVLDDLEAVKRQKNQLEGKVSALQEENQLLKKSLESAVEKNEALLEKISEHMRVFNSRVDEAVGQIACKEYLKSDEYKHRDRKGANASCYRTDVKNEDIIEKYQSGMSIKQLAESYSMTENGMRRRLKELGVWEDRRFTANKVTCS